MSGVVHKLSRGIKKLCLGNFFKFGLEGKEMGAITWSCLEIYGRKKQIRVIRNRQIWTRDQKGWDQFSRLGEGEEHVPFKVKGEVIGLSTVIGEFEDDGGMLS